MDFHCKIYPVIRQSNSNISPDKAEGMKTEWLQSPWKAAERFRFCWALVFSSGGCPPPAEELWQSFHLREVQKAPWKLFAPVRLLMCKWEFWAEAQFGHGAWIPQAKRWLQNSPHCFLLLKWSVFNPLGISHVVAARRVIQSCQPAQQRWCDMELSLHRFYCLAFCTEGGGGSSKCYPKCQRSVRTAAWVLLHVNCHHIQCWQGCKFSVTKCKATHPIEKIQGCWVLVMAVTATQWLAQEQGEMRLESGRTEDKAVRSS